MTCRAAQSGTFPPAAPPRWAPCKGTYQGLFHGTVALHHTAILVNQELPRGGVRRRGPQQLPHAAGQPWSSPPSLKPLPTLVKFHLIAFPSMPRPLGWIFIHFHSGWASSPLTQILLNKSNLTL